MPVSDETRLYAMALRRALKTIISAMDDPSGRVDTAIISAFLQYVADTERFSRSQRVTGPIIKPVLTDAVLESRSIRETLDRAIYHLERRFFLGESANATMAGPERGTPRVRESNRP